MKQQSTVSSRHIRDRRVMLLYASSRPERASSNFVKLIRKYVRGTTMTIFTLTVRVGEHFFQSRKTIHKLFAGEVFLITIDYHFWIQ